MEYNGWSEGNPPSHHEILPYTRLLGGPVDYTPGVFDIEYKSIKGKPQLRQWGLPGTQCRVHTTLCKQIANWVVLYSPMQMACDLLENYRNHPAFQFFRDFEADCDASAAVQGEVGEYIALWRRAGDRFFYAATTDESARNLTQPLDFLAPGVTYSATVYADAPDADWISNPYAYTITTQTVTAGDTLTVRLAAGGGQAIVFKPVD
jgi:alpha-glucosidase